MGDIFNGVKDLIIVTPSKWLSKLVKQSYLKEYSVKVINNGIDTNIFKPTSSNFRKEYNLETYINQRDNTIQESNHNTSLALFVFEKQLNTFLNYKRTLSPSIKKKLKYKTCTTQSGKSLLIEKDPLHHCYYLVYSGRYVHMADSIEIMLPLYEQYKKV